MPYFKRENRVIERKQIMVVHPPAPVSVRFATYRDEIPRTPQVFGYMFSFAATVRNIGITVEGLKPFTKDFPAEVTVTHVFHGTKHSFSFKPTKDGTYGVPGEFEVNYGDKLTVDVLNASYLDGFVSFVYIPAGLSKEVEDAIQSDQEQGQLISSDESTRSEGETHDVIEGGEATPLIGGS